ncbi:MAG: PIN domain-containing protein [Proteobacteria bacterium]|nr:PIN domain-containing protein [Pseudomonadota bacterium]
MVLVDTSVWVSHFRESNSGLVNLLNNTEVICHPFIVGELACGNLKDRMTVISLLEALPMAVLVEHDEVLAFIESHDLMGKGLGYVDVHLLASAVLTSVSLWTIDKKLEKAAKGLRCKY